MQKDYPMVNVHNKWVSLEEVIAGVSSQTTVEFRFVPP